MLYGITLVDVHCLTTRYARSALPAAPVIEERSVAARAVARLAASR